MRFTKQFIYGTFFLAIWGIAGFLIYLAVKPAPSCFDGKLNQGEEAVDCGGPCESCEIRRLRPIQALPAQLFSSGGFLSALIELRNPNTAYGAARLPYQVQFYGAGGEELLAVSRESFVYPGEIKFVLEQDVPLDPRRVARAAVALGTPEWQSLASFPLPRITSREVAVAPDAARGQTIVTGVIVNDNPFKVRRARVLAMVSDERGSRVAASRTILQDLAPGEERSFRIAAPFVDIPGIGPSNIRIFVEVER